MCVYIYIYIYIHQGSPSPSTTSAARPSSTGSASELAFAPPSGPCRGGSRSHVHGPV